MTKTSWTSAAGRAARLLLSALGRQTSAPPRPSGSSTQTSPAPDRPRPGPRPSGSATGSTRPASPSPSTSTSTRPSGSGAAATGDAYPGDFTGRLAPQYSPVVDGKPDPGEIVWTWVPYEEDFTQGKDRPVLLVGRDGAWLLGLMLTSKDHSRDAAAEARYGRRWLDIGSGPWDAQGRDSEVRLDRVVRVDPSAVRREGAVMAEGLFTQVVASVRTGR